MTLNSGEENLGSAVIDIANGYAYFGTYTEPGIVVKVALGSGSNPPTRTGAVTLNSGENNLLSAVIDTVNGYAYFGTFVTPGVVVKVSLGSGSNPPSRTGAVTMTDEGTVESSVIDSENGYAYFGTSTSPGMVIKVALGSGANPPTRIGAVTLNSGENNLLPAVIDTVNGYAYFGASGGEESPFVVIKVALGSGANPPTRIGAVTLNSGEDYLVSAGIDTTNGYAYFGTETSPGRVIKVALGSGSNPPTRVGAVTLNSGESNLYAGGIDTTNGYAYFGTFTTPGKVVKVALGSGSNPPTRVGAVTLDSGEDGFRSAVIDPTNGYGYFGTHTSPGIVVKVALGSGSNPPTRVGAVTLNSGENVLYSAGIDVSNSYAYFGTGTYPGKVVKVALGSGSNPPTRTAAVTFDSGEDVVTGAVIDLVNGYGYFVTEVSSFARSPVFKVSLGTGSTRTLRIEYGAKSSTCSAVSSWTQVAASPSTEHWAMSNSTNITNAAVTTNSAGVTNGGSSFVAGKIHDTTSETSPILLASTTFTEVEYSIKATNDSTSSGNYCFRLTDGGTATGFTFTNYAEASVAAGGGSNDPTISNAITMSRLKAGASANYSFSFVLQNTITGTLTITFPAGFTVTGALTSGTCTGGTVGTFGFTGSTLTAVKTACAPGILTVSGATVTNHSTPGSYYISWVNDDPGGSQVYIIDDDQVTVTANVDATITMNVGSQAAATACDGTFAGNGGTVALGVLTSGAVTSSDAASVNHICTRLSTNASGGAVMTVKSLNGVDGLKSTSVPTDKIPSPGGSSTITAGTAGYAICTGSAGGDKGNDAIAGSASPVRSSPFNGASCTSTGHNVGGLTTSAQNLWTLSSGAQNAFVRVYVKAAISPVTAAHSDYTDTLTFIGTGTF